MTTYEQGRDFDCVAANIHCRADREGANVHEIKVKARRSRTVRVLAHDLPSAYEAAYAYAEKRP